VPDEQQVPAPRAALLDAAAEHVGLDAELLAEVDECRVGDGELLVRGRRERERVVLGEDRLAGLEVERHGGGARLRDVRYGERPRQALRQR
jgi:hypothetical protein